MHGWSALILAGGAGRRFGANAHGGKLVAPLAGAPVIRRTVAAVAGAGFGELMVVTGAEHARIVTALEGLTCTIIHAEGWAEGMAASLRTGIAALGDEAAGVCVFLGDMPLVPVGLCGELVQLATAAGYAARPLVAGQPGHPVCFTRAAFPDLMRLEGDSGAGHVLRGRSSGGGGGVATLETSATGALFDIDQPDDLLAAERAWKA